jgi:glycosyltransferase involved in cell wall biosynthesis
MPSLFVNAVACKTGGAVNDLLHTLPLLRERLETRGWEVHTWVVAPGRRALEARGQADERVHEVPVGPPAARAMWEYRGFASLVERRRPAVVFQFSNFVPRRLAAPQIVVLRSPTFFSPTYLRRGAPGAYKRLRGMIGGRMSSGTVRRAARTFVISETACVDVRRMLGRVGRRVEVAHLGVSPPPAWFHAARGDRAALLARVDPSRRGRLEAALDHPVVLHVSTYYRHKNLGDLMRAVERLDAGGTRLRLVATAGVADPGAGGDPREPGDVDLARRLEARGVLVDLGPVPRDEVLALLGLADVFAFPSSVESFGHPILEALAAGVPTVAASTAIHREIGGDAVAYHPVGDADALAGLVRDLLADPERRRRLAEGGPARARVFPWERHVDVLVRAILDLAGPDRDRA